MSYSVVAVRSDQLGVNLVSFGYWNRFSFPRFKSENIILISEILTLNIQIVVMFV